MKNWFLLFLILVLTLVSFQLLGRTPVILGKNNEVSVLSDKAYRYADKDIFEVFGNVIITRGNDTLYGESATLNLADQKINVEGSVRFTTNNITMYGSKIQYNMGNSYLSLENARVISKDFSLFGKNISRIGENRILAKEAEFSSCHDCPHSWSVYGGEVDITVDEYVKVKDALFKVNGVPMIFIPYFVFPIKRGRETGLLFPKLYTSSTIDGVVFKQPFFWAIDDSKDLTLSPAIFGNRGPGSNFEYRQMLGDGKWFEFNSLYLDDSIYNPNYIRPGQTEEPGSRYFIDYEHKYQMGFWGNHHLSVNDSRDLDIVRDLDAEIAGQYFGNDLGVSSFLEAKSELFQFSMEGNFRENLIIEDPREFDHSYVQVLPKLSLGMTPITLFQSKVPGFRKLDFGFKSDYTVFKQNKDLEFENEFIRNANRINLESFLKVNVGHLGPFRFESQVYGDLQNYRFPRVNSDKEFEKFAYFSQNEVTLEIDRIFGLAFKDKVKRTEVKDLSGDKVQKKDVVVTPSTVMGELPEFEKDLADEYITINRNSYRHGQEYKLIHYKILDSSVNGNASFGGQIEGREGIFDYIDSLREREAEIGFIESRKNLIKKDTLELQWNNSVIKKSVSNVNAKTDGLFLRDHFEYTKIFSFNISQGFDVSSDSTREEGFKEKLQRLAVVTSLNLGKLSMNVSDYYFYDGTHIFELGTAFQSYYLDGTLDFAYSSIDENTPTNTARTSLTFRPIEVISLYGQYDVDLIGREDNNRQQYEITYMPTNNCWEIKLAYSDDNIETQYLVDFRLKFNSEFSTFF